MEPPSHGDREKTETQRSDKQTSGAGGTNQAFRVFALSPCLCGSISRGDSHVCTLPVARSLVLLDCRPGPRRRCTAAFQDKQGEYLDVLLNGKVVARYMYAHDKSTPKRLDETYKPYLHIFDADGKGPITKGVGGEYTHHRGIFAGWMKITHNGKTYDRWHMKGGEIVHQKFTEKKADKDGAVFTSLTHWNDADGKPILIEERTMALSPGRRAPARLIVDFTTKLKAVDGDIKLDGDPEHAGVQFRPADEMDRKETVYLFPKEEAKPHQDRRLSVGGRDLHAGGQEAQRRADEPPRTIPKKTKLVGLSQLRPIRRLSGGGDQIRRDADAEVPLPDRRRRAACRWS